MPDPWMLMLVVVILAFVIVILLAVLPIVYRFGKDRGFRKGRIVGIEEGKQIIEGESKEVSVNRTGRDEPVKVNLIPVNSQKHGDMMDLVHHADFTDTAVQAGG